MKRFVMTVFFLLVGLLFAGAREATGAVAPSTANNTAGMPEKAAPVTGAGLSVQPGELNLGSIGPGEEASGSVYLKKTGAARSLTWSTEGPEGWMGVETGKLAGNVGEQPEAVRLRLFFVNDPGSGRIRNANLLLTLEGSGGRAVFRREVSVGPLRETLNFDAAGQTRSVTFQARLTEQAAAASMQVQPLRLDVGTVRAGEEVSRRIHITNRGREILKWRAAVAGAKGMPAEAAPPAGRFVTFRNEAVAGTGTYTPLRPPPDGPEMLGRWEEREGYPVSQDEQNSLRFRFTGTGVSLVMQRTPEGDPLLVYLDQQLITTIDGFSDHRERAEILLADGLPDAVHLLTLVNGGGSVVVEGVRIFGKPIVKGPRGWVTVFPDSGVTTRETDYVTIALNTAKLAPGIYGDRLFIKSNGGDAEIELIAEIAGEAQTRLLDVHRYQAGYDYLYTTTPQEEAVRLQAKGYRDLGVAFRLFSAGTAGTTELYRWYNPGRGDHYYGTDPAGGKALPGYLFEGAIGSIATVRLVGARELYRWLNPATGRHFYTTDQSGEGITKSGYRFEGIAGYVR